MHRLLRLLIAVLLVGIAEVSQAAETRQLTRVSGGIRTGDAVISGSAGLITGIDIDCGGTACTASLYDSSTLGGTTNANGVFEGGAAANGNLYVDFSDAPIRTLNGIALVADANIDGVTVYMETTP